jgi:predicted DNA-binding transcriptional regulator YafY
MFDVEGFRSMKIMRGDVVEPEQDPAEHFATAFGRYTHFEAEDSRLRFMGLAARQLRRRRFHQSQCVVYDDDDCIEATFRVGRCPEFVGWLLSLMPEVEVLEPLSLRMELATRMSRGAEVNARESR